MIFYIVYIRYIIYYINVWGYPICHRQLGYTRVIDHLLTGMHPQMLSPSDPKPADH